MTVDDVIEFAFEEHPEFTIIAVVLVLIGALTLVAADSIHEQRKAYSIYCRETGTTNLTYDEFTTMNNQHLLKPLEQK